MRQKRGSSSGSGLPFGVEGSRLGWSGVLHEKVFGDEKLIVWHGLHGPVPILIHIRPCGSGKATPAARREAPC